MNRREFLASAGVLALPAPSFAQRVSRPDSRKRPNILLLFTDEHRFDALGCMGNRQIGTPHLDRLAASGVRFTQAVIPTPVFVAARMSLITGQRAARTHWPGNKPLPGFWPHLPTLMDLLDVAGYRTHAVGKVHFRGLQYGFHHIESMEEGVVHRPDDDYLMYLKAHGVRTSYPQGLRDLLYFQPQTCGIPLEHSESTWVAGRSVDFLRNHVRYRGDQPFFLWSSWIAPHPPFAPCKPYDSMYDPAGMPLPVYPDRPLASLPSNTWGLRGRLDGAHLDPDRIRRIRALYYGQISHVDDGVGRVLAELDRLGLADRTVVVFATDHGVMLGDHGLSEKKSPYEFSVRIPLILRWPGRTEAGRVSSDLVSTLDLLPTIVTELGLPFPDSADAPVGQSLLSADGGGLGPARDAMFVDYGQGEKRWVGIRTRQYKYTLWASGGMEELYDLEKDPEERHNLAESHNGLRERLRSRVLDWERRSALAQSFEGGRFPGLSRAPGARHNAAERRHQRGTLAGQPAARRTGDCRDLRGGFHASHFQGDQPGTGETQPWNLQTEGRYTADRHPVGGCLEACLMRLDPGLLFLNDSSKVSVRAGDSFCAGSIVLACRMAASRNPPAAGAGTTNSWGGMKASTRQAEQEPKE